MTTTWVKPQEIAEVLGCDPGHINRLARQGKLAKIPNPERGGHNLYSLEDAIALRETRAGDMQAEPVEVEPVLGDVSAHDVQDGPYYYDESRDVYVFHLPSKPRTQWAVSGTIVRRVQAAYSNDGDAATLNQIAREMKWRRVTVREMLAALGTTHDSLPFTRESVAAEDEGALVEDLVRMKEERVHVKAERISWAKTKDLADKWRNFERAAREFVEQIDIKPAPKMPRWKRDRIRRKGSADDGCSTYLVTHATDLHYGKKGWILQTGEEMNRDVTETRLLDSTSRLIDRVLRWGEPRLCLLPVGGDWFHIDGYRYETTRGTPQDTDGLPLQVAQGGFGLAIAQIEMMRQAFAHVEVVQSRGNHDYWMTSMLMLYLSAYYKDAPDVTIGRCEMDREYRKLGQTIVGITHGDKVKDKDLGALMAVEAKELWGDTLWRLWFTGHWHSQITSEGFGVEVHHLRSLAGSDRWHKAHGYVGNRKALEGFVLDEDEGPIVRVTATA